MNTLVRLPKFAVNGGPRTEMYENQEYMVYPVIALVEGVHNDLFYPKSEIAKFPAAWNGRPVPVQHPKNKKGEYISANDPRVLEKQNVGFCFNFDVDDKDRLKGEVWINRSKAIAFDENLISQMNNNMEISTCLFLDGDGKPGVWNNENYQEAVFNFRPDHVAILPGNVGACSWQDGCGIRTNQKEVAFTKDLIDILKAKGLYSLEMSMEEVQTQIIGFVNALDYQEGERHVFHFLEAVYDDFFVYSRTPTNQDSKYRFYKKGYSLDKNEQVKIEDSQMEVRRKVSFSDVEGNEIQTNKEDTPMPKEKGTPCCPDKVAALIADEKTPWLADDAEYLNSLSSEKLAALEKLAVVEEKPQVSVKPEPAAIVNSEPDQKPMTVNEYIANAPQEVRDMLSSAMATHQQARGALIQGIMANENCAFTKEQLEGMELNMLRAISKLATVKTPEVDLSRPIYPGRGPAPNIAGAVDDEPLISTLEMVDKK